MNLLNTHIIGRQTRERIVRDGNCAGLKEYCIRCTGLSDAATPYSMVRVNSTFRHLLVCTGGMGQVLVGNRWQTCSPGEVYLSPPGLLHAFHAMPGKRWQFAWVIYVGHLPWHSALPTENVKKVGNGHALSSAIEGLYRETSEGSHPETCTRWLALIDLYWRQLGETNTNYGRLSRLWENIDQNLAHDWSIEEMSDHVGWSQEHLRRICKMETGRSPIMHVTWLRMNRAVTLLRSSPLNIKAIAEEVGYANQFAFSSAFRRVMGGPPSRYLG